MMFRMDSVGHSACIHAVPLNSIQDKKVERSGMKQQRRHPDTQCHVLTIRLDALSGSSDTSGPLPWQGRRCSHSVVKLQDKCSKAKTIDLETNANVVLGIF